MSLLARVGIGVGVRAIGKIARRIVREQKLQRKAYREGYADAKAGKQSRH